MIFGYTYWAAFWMGLASATGFVMASYGKKRPDPASLVTGVVLLLYPYLVVDAVPMALIGLGLVGAFALGRRSRWF